MGIYAQEGITSYKRVAILMAIYSDLGSCSILPQSCVSLQVWV